MNSIRQSTKRQYSVYLTRFLSFCTSCNLSITCVSEVDVINFLQQLYTSGGGYSLINTACSAISTFLNMAGFPLKSTNLLSKFKRGVFNDRPSLPRYTSTWDPQVVLNYFTQLSGCIDLNYISAKCATLLALTSCSRISTIHSIRISDLKFSGTKLTIKIGQLQKQSRPGFHQSAIELERYCDATTCVVQTLELYLSLVQSRRATDSHLESLFLTTTKPYKNASKDTIARWIKQTLHKAGIPDIYKAHSTRSAAVSKLAKIGTDVSIILKKAGWSSSNTFHKFYNR